MLPLRLSTVITEMNIHQIVNSVFTSNAYILSVEGKDRHVLIDIGDIAPIKQCVQEKCGTVQALFLTHTHYDHIYGIKDLLRLYPDCTVYTSSFGKEALGSDKLNFSRYHNDPVIWMGDNVTVLHENDKVEIFPGIFVEVFETPGHDKSCLTYKVCIPVMETFMSKLFRYLERIYKAVSFLFIPHYVRNPESDH